MNEEFKITPEKNAVNMIPIGLEDVPVYASDISAGLAIDGTPALNTPPTATADPNIIPAGGGSIIRGFLKSQNYNKGTSGWAINGDGSIEAETGYFRGDITGASGTFSGTITATVGNIGGWSIGATSITAYGGSATATNTGATSPGTMADDDTVGGVAWANPDNAKASDNSYADCYTTAQYSHYLKATNFGFAVPTGATINGILVEIERKLNSSEYGWGIVDSEVKIVKSDGSIGTTNKASAVNWVVTEAYFSYGASDNLWGETWTAEDINDTDFGVALSIRSLLAGATADVDHIRITVYYTSATTAGSVGMSSASTGADDIRFWAGNATPASAPFKVTESGKITASDIVATGTINAQAGYLSAGVYVDTVNGLLCESGGLNVGSAGHIRGGQTDYNTGTGFFLGYSTGYKFSIGNPAGNYLTWDGTTLKVAGFLITNISLGDASDGDVTISANTTLTRDMYYDDLTVDATKILTAAGYRIFVRGTLTNNGTIQNNGGTATTYSGAGGGASGTLRGGTTGGNGKTRNGNYDQGGGGGGGGGMVLIAANTIINNGTIRANGGNGANGARYSVGAGASPTAGTSLDCGKGGNGGAGGDSGGVGGVVTQTNQGFKNVMIGINDFDSVLSKGVGGGGGGGGGEDTGAQDDGVAGGGGGGGGGFVLIYYYTATFGTEQANKGTGGSISGGDGIDGTVLEIQI